jgi:uncharacterized membrane protein YvbJ
MIDLKCSECGCVVPPDVTKCPNCGKKYTEASPKAKSNGNGITVGRIAYTITCNVHGKITITANMASQLTGCPFC